MNVLIVEDDEQSLYLVRVLLESRGHHVTGARDGPAGIAAAQESLPDVILLDIQLPYLDGYAVTRALRALPSMSAVPIVAVTSYAMKIDRAKALAAGCDAHVEKPIDPDTFVAQVEQIVSTGR